MTPWHWLLLAVVIATPLIADLRRIQDRELIRARDKWFAMFAACVILFVSAYELWLALVGLALFLRWRSHHTLSSIVPWCMIGAWWTLVGALPPTLVRWAPPGWLAVTTIELAVITWQWFYLRSPDPALAGVRRPIGTFGQRTLMACWFALVFPFVAFTPAMVIPGVGLLMTSSWLAFLAAMAGISMLRPATLWVTLPLVGGGLALIVGSRALNRWRLLEYTPRGDTTDSIRQRLQTWTYVLAHYFKWPTVLLGRGPYVAVYDLLKWSARYRQELVYGHFHCEPLEFVYEWGVLGLLAIVAFAWRVVPHLALGDPWSAAVVAGAVMAGGTLFCRCTPLGATWLAMCAVVVHR